ncbi:hypothetical protein SA2016_3465 [Sinomonas atrocyanea]|uniref:Uncharacterized protein n=1 Tax=Sinomonas atrocyanea TaxID=37927 RepID=A0A127A668_9MICC|nr:hypothetical protein [Sinomonas atrocyanea]AMM34125.1 hypothetical protein SA2016_3465 [Sinomonas atrocyanea]GEB65171.1 hypothetical protein SAT01_26190 [Sinomonas atrocyanea]GGG58570.1 hypothetical protein GCM10007172_06780 [Sinomonas atrocyanea]
MGQTSPGYRRTPTPGPRPGFSGSGFGAGIVAGAAVLYIVYGAILAAVGPQGGIGTLAFLPGFLYLAGALVLAIRKGPYRNLGAGLLVGLGVWLFLGGEIWLSMLAQTGGIA